MQRLSLGVQTFKKLREENLLYVDKTEYAHKVMDKGGCFFMSRPRRFGKSLFLSTLMELAEGNRALFEGTWIGDKWDWTRKYTVLHFAFAGMPYQKQGLDKAIFMELEKYYKTYNLAVETTDIKVLLYNLIVYLHKNHGKVVFLVDEYDKPLLDYIEKTQENRAEENRETMKMFYSVLKDAEQHLHLIFITGITKFAKVSIFSDLNHLTDLTFHKDFVTTYGYTQTEMEAHFTDYLLAFLEKNKDYTMESLLAKVKKWYNGYSWNGTDSVYNPYGLSHFFDSQRFINSWFESGTPSFLVPRIFKTDSMSFENIEKNINFLSFSSFDSIDIVTLMFQAGYLTLKSLDVDGFATLDYPNQEVRESMYYYILDEMGEGRNRNLPPVRNLAKAFEANDLRKAENIIKHAFADLPYDIYRKRNTEQTEGFYHGIMHVLFNYLGIYMQSEVHSTDGRADAVVFTNERIFIFEFKFNASADAALTQLKEKNYAAKYENSGKEIVLIGANFTKRTRRLDSFKYEIVNIDLSH
jgi:Predicted AAA-ATPase/PD-(D/E)XK nuclease superfamily